MSVFSERFENLEIETPDMFSTEPVTQFPLYDLVLKDIARLERLSRKVTDLVANESKQPKEGTWVVTSEIPVENWLLGGLTLPEFKARLAAEKT